MIGLHLAPPSTLELGGAAIGFLVLAYMGVRWGPGRI